LVRQQENYGGLQIQIWSTSGSVPLTERVEQTVLRQLQSKGRVSFTDIWEAVSIAFPNSLTSDQSSIKNSLEDFARPVKGGDWLIKSNFRPGVVEKDHTTMNRSVK